MKVLRYIAYTLGTLLALSLVALLVALWAYRDIPAAELEAKEDAGNASATVRVLTLGSVFVDVAAPSVEDAFVEDTDGATTAAPAWPLATWVRRA